MSRSSATWIAYDLRPVKQTERRIILDMLRLSRDAGVDTPSYTYVGMGGVRFYDFEMLHRYLGVRKMVSLEQDREIIPRCEFNKPFGFIKVINKTSSDYIDEWRSQDPHIVWLDYDWGLSKEATSDIAALMAKISLGSFFFVTVSAELKASLQLMASDDRVEHFKEELGPLAVDCSRDDVSPEGYPLFVERVLSAAFSRAAASLPKGHYSPMISIKYRDSVWMVTVGGCLCDEKKIAADVEKKLEDEFPFLYEGAGPYELIDMNFTNRERVLLDRHTTTEVQSADDAALLKKLKFGQKKLKAYGNVVRFFPKYVETFM